MIVYRIEKFDGTGAYHQRRAFEEAGVEDPTYLRANYWGSGLPRDPHPSPSEDGIEYVATNDRFGFADIETLAAWMFRAPEDPVLLETVGYLVATYTVATEDVKFGRRQVAFDITGAQRIDSALPTVFVNKTWPADEDREAGMGAKELIEESWNNSR